MSNFAKVITTIFILIPVGYTIAVTVGVPSDLCFDIALGTVILLAVAVIIYKVVLRPTIFSERLEEAKRRSEERYAEYMAEFDEEEQDD